MTDHKVLAQAVLDAQKIHEESWIPGEGTYECFGATVAYPGRYTKDNDEAAKEALPDDTKLAYVVGLLNTTAWNDIQCWAEEVLGIYDREPPIA